METQIAKVIWNDRYRFNNETEEDFYRRLSSLLEGENSEKLYTAVSNGEFMPGGRIVHNVGTGKKNNTMSNCYVLPIKADTFPAILKGLEDAIKTWSAGGGCGFNFSILRPKGSLIRSKNETIKEGVVGILEMFNSTCNTIKGSGSREGAMMSILDIWHPDIVDFITVKQNLTSLQRMNMSVAISDKFMDAVKNNLEWDLVFPDITHDAYNDDWDGNLNKWVESGYPVVIHKSINAKELMTLIMKSGYNYGEPGVVFIDTINNGNTLNSDEFINATNPCGEQPLPAYSSCNLGSINVAKLILDPFTENAKLDINRLSELVRVGIRTLDAVLDVNSYPLKDQKLQVKQKRPIGLGITGLGTALILGNLKYGSPKSKDFTETLMREILNTAYRTSMELAMEKGSFPAFNPDTFNFPKGLDTELVKEIKQNGLRNSRLLSIAPTGTISLLLDNPTSGIEPMFDHEYTRTARVGNSKETILCKDYAYLIADTIFKGKIPNEIKENFVISSELSVEDHIGIQVSVQKYLDSSCSKTIILPNDYDFNKITDLYTNAWKSGLKGFTIYRDGSRDAVLKRVEDNNSKDYVSTARKTKSEQFSIRHKLSYKNRSTLLITVGICDDGTPIEVVAKVPKQAVLDENGNFNSNQYANEVALWDAVCRLVSISLQSGCSLDKVIEQLRDSSLSMYDLPAIISRVLVEYPKTITHLEISDKKNIYQECPKCGKKGYVISGGCASCIECGYSKACE